MTSERWRHIEELYYAALEIAEPERGVFLAQACGADEELRREVESLLAAHDRAGSFIAENALADHAERIAVQPSAEDQPTAMLPNPLINPLADSAQRAINQYRIISLLGKGGMGEVWLAEDTRLKRKVALKLLPAEFTNDADRLRRFEQEALAISALNHPNIITIHEIGESDAGRFIVMELVSGQTLRAIAAEPVALDSLIAWGVQLAKALQVAHAAGITHRDIKPDNIMLRDDGYVKILDFGLARLMPTTATDSEAATLMRQTTPGALLGTVAYMSPEQTRGETVTHASDIFSLGIVFYELAAGRHPFKADSLVGMLHSINSQSPEPPARLNPDIPGALESLILRMLEKEGRLRPTAAEVDQALSESAQAADSDSTTRRQQSALYAPEATAAPSIAVLPFANISNDPDNEYFCDGLAEELLNALSKIEALRVAARTSAFSFKGKETDIREIGQKLNVGAVLEGSVRKAGNRLRITAQLVNVADGYHLWSERYDRELQDIFDIQDEITLAIVDALKVKLLGAEKAAVTKRYTDNTEAYQLYLQGRFHFSKWTEEGFRKAIKCYEQALAHEPNYAPAFGGLAYCYYCLWWFGHLPPAESEPKAREAITKALALDPALAEAQLTLANIKFYFERDWPGAERKFKQALELSPNSAEATSQYGLFLGVMGRQAEAVAQGMRALELDPLSLVTNIIVGWIFWTVGQADQMLAQGRKLIELEPNFFGGHTLLGVGYWILGDYEQAISHLQKAVNLGDRRALSSLGCFYGIVGEQDRARQTLEELQALSAQRYVQRYDLAIVHAGLGEMDRAFELLEQAYEQREGILVFLKQVALRIPGLNADPRLADLMRRIGLPE
ncbi:MAG: protein kinase [Blastocatellales bacterium]